MWLALWFSVSIAASLDALAPVFEDLEGGFVAWQAGRSDRVGAFPTTFEDEAALRAAIGSAEVGLMGMELELQFDGDTHLNLFVAQAGQPTLAAMKVTPGARQDAALPLSRYQGRLQPFADAAAAFIGELRGPGCTQLTIGLPPKLRDTLPGPVAKAFWEQADAARRNLGDTCEATWKKTARLRAADVTFVLREGRFATGFVRGHLEWQGKDLGLRIDERVTR